MNPEQLFIVAILTAVLSVVSAIALAFIAYLTAKANSKLNVIHVLVNSNMTAAMRDSLDSTVRERAALMELAQVRIDSGKVPHFETTAAITMADAKIAELAPALAERDAAHAPVIKQE
ncbi:MAG TPA: hypothetical protein VHQ92_01035 [Pseudolabrys sp.]|jgi:hypothetical protein|nr:hypothetical protein [Pseudolabrys sp.]